MKRSDHFRFRLEPDLKRAAVIQAASQYESLASVIRRFLREWVAESRGTVVDPSPAFGGVLAVDKIMDRVESVGASVAGDVVANRIELGEALDRIEKKLDELPDQFLEATQGLDLGPGRD